MILWLLLGGSFLVRATMGMRKIPQKIGCAMLCTVPFLIFGLITLEPLVTGVRQSSTAGLAIPFGTIYALASAATGSLFGMLIVWLRQR